MAGKFIPSGDRDFAAMAHGFASVVAGDAVRVAVSEDEAEALSAAVARYRAAVNRCFNNSTRTPAATREKREARAQAERHVRRIGMLADYETTGQLPPLPESALGHTRDA